MVVDDLSSGKREHLNPSARFVVRDIRVGIDADGAENGSVHKEGSEVRFRVTDLKRSVAAMVELIQVD